MNRYDVIRQLLEELDWTVDSNSIGCLSEILQAFDRLGWFVGTSRDRAVLDAVSAWKDRDSVWMDGGTGQTRDQYLGEAEFAIVCAEQARRNG